MKKILRSAVVAAALLIGATACSASQPALVGTWGDPSQKGRPSLEFTGSETTGDYSGTDGCNSVGGSYAAEGSTIDLGVMRSTLMFCEGVDTWLSQARSASLDGGTLTLFDENGDEIGTLERHDG
ncbi:META domain-containing protein [Leucobacter ruminantium]|uniref:META domain-containing protein n=1 Tax=Leucobacter ruminantium TaxID=1289170 RepID=A0A939LSX1_9MICO|nr:META domain-containing protein [Leucobacter ruminantium]MBO1804209.1 META domain-containing protein [Leucobacter ruminantium]